MDHRIDPVGLRRVAGRINYKNWHGFPNLVGTDSKLAPGMFGLLKIIVSQLDAREHCKKS